VGIRWSAIEGGSTRGGSMTSGRSTEQGRLSGESEPTSGSAVPTPQAVNVALAQALTALREAAAGTRFALDIPGADAARESGAELVRQLDDYVLPRLQQLDAPLLTVVGGSTGAGK
jgi:hypothetical protein